MDDFSGQTMEELKVLASEMTEYVDEETGKKIHLNYLIGGKLGPFVEIGDCMRCYHNSNKFCA